MTRRLSATLLATTMFALVPALAQAQAPQLADGPGKQQVESLCTGCHQTNMITGSSGYTREHWQELTGTMIDLSTVPAERDAIMQYLASHYPPNTRNAAKLVSGPVQIKFQEWQTKTLGNRSRDPVQGPDGLIWWAGQWGNMIGSIDPQTGAMKEYPLPANAKPHTVEPDSKGNIWYTGNVNGTIGYLDPKTGKITEYKLSDPNAKDPHTAIFDKKGTLWFTLQNSNMIGRLDPATGDIKLITAKVANSKPYGIKEDSDGNFWIACNGAACLYKMDAATMALTEIKLPTPGTTVRRLDIGADGMVWYVNSGQGKLGRVNPKTGEIKEWDSPSGQKSHPYAIVITRDGAVWYNESAVRPDALVRFDPKTESFQSWPVPSGNVYAGIIRHMRLDRDGNILIHQTSSNKIMRVTVEKRAASR